MLINLKALRAKAATMLFLAHFLRMFWVFFWLFRVFGGAWGHAGDIPKASQASDVILDDLGDRFWTLWGPPGRPGGAPGTPKMACRCHPRGLFWTLWWPKDGQASQNRILDEKSHIVQALGMSKM